MDIKNAHIKKLARMNDVRLYEIAMWLEISEATLQRWMRVPLTSEREAKIVSAIHELSKEAC